MQDGLTRLWNQDYLNYMYYDYVNNHNDSMFIMIDLSNFKKINDSYGHEAGDKCLKIFAGALIRLFYNDLLFRLHGDEFSIITKKSEEEVNCKFEYILDLINDEATKGNIPLPFGFNAGSARLERNLRITMDKADYMMYKAKKDGNIYQPYSNVLYQEKVDNNLLITDINELIEEDGFTHYGRSLYNKSEEEQKMIQIYTKDMKGRNIFGGTSYSILRENSTISKFDKANLERLINNIDLIKKDYLYFVFIDYKSLFSIKTLAPLLDSIDKRYINNIVLSIDIDKIESNEYSLVIEIVSLLKELGFKIRLDKYSNRVATHFIEETTPDFIKIATQEWNIAYVDKHKSAILKNTLLLLKAIKNNTKIIFEMVENINEKNYLNSISFDDTLFSGNYYSYEKKLTLK